MSSTHPSLSTLSQATWLFRKHQIRRIDAVILTHGHQDAIAGLGKSLAYDLRAFTAPPSPQAGAVIPIYLSRATLDAVAQQFPYLVDKNQATGGGDVPSLNFRVFDDPLVDGEGVGGESMADGFDVHGIWVVPLAVHHGKYFTPPDQVERLDVPEKQTQTAPQTPPQVLQSSSNEIPGKNAIQPSLTSLLHRKIEETVKETVPFYCYGFVFDGKMIYLSDVSYIPTGTWEKMVSAIQPGTSGSSSPPTNDTISPSKLPFSASLPPSSRSLPCLILDCLRLEPHGSHLSFIQSLSICLHLSPRETYLVGFTHPNSHNEWVAGCREVEGTRAEGEEDGFLAAVEKSAVRQGKEMMSVWERAKSEWKGFVRPAYDGQVVRIE
ncbi:hypothetical protein QFC22_004517 [Naganishia vaughanmartiniae]|uniref:Uncharacterized protein n=1 Tax=Naganishia vaughanmartiniae TaxID=1424756 RepID=A0ACC2WYJ0_9TREE|nr:hypothetical protein QFC22_004517 [Naganishia vaughanmartiniae]